MIIHSFFIYFNKVLLIVLSSIENSQIKIWGIKFEHYEGIKKLLKKLGPTKNTLLK